MAIQKCFAYFRRSQVDGDQPSYLRQTARYVAATLVLGTLVLATTIDTAKAEDKLSVSISPVLFNLTADPGQTLTNTLKITNASADKPQAIVMSVEAFTGTETGEAVVTTDGNPDYSLNEWVTFSPASFTIPPGQSQNVTYTIKIPANAEPGGRYGSLLASTPQENLNKGTGASTIQKIGALVLLRVSGPISYQASVKSFTPAKTFFERSPVTFTMLIHNNSTVHIEPKGYVTIANMFGHKVVDIPVDQRIILPQEDRLLTVTWDKSIAIGHYTATLLLVYGDNGNQITATQSFYVFPWKVGLPIVVGIILVLWFLIARRQRLIEALRILAGKK